MKKLLQFLMVLGVSLFMTSCYYDAYLELPPDESGIIPTDVSFKTDIEPLFARCIGCHGGTQSPDLRVGNAYSSLVPQYVTIGDGVNSKLYNNLPGNGHPVDVGFSLTADEIALIKIWIDEGAENN